MRIASLPHTWLLLVLVAVAARAQEKPDPYRPIPSPETFRRQQWQTVERTPPGTWALYQGAGPEWLRLVRTEPDSTCWFAVHMGTQGRRQLVRFRTGFDAGAGIFLLNDSQFGTFGGKLAYSYSSLRRTFEDYDLPVGVQSIHWVGDRLCVPLWYFEACHEWWSDEHPFLDGYIGSTDEYGAIYRGLIAFGRLEFDAVVTESGWVTETSLDWESYPRAVAQARAREDLIFYGFIDLLDARVARFVHEPTGLIMVLLPASIMVIQVESHEPESTAASITTQEILKPAFLIAQQPINGDCFGRGLGDPEWVGSSTIGFIEPIGAETPSWLEHNLTWDWRLLTEFLGSSTLTLPTEPELELLESMVVDRAQMFGTRVDGSWGLTLVELADAHTDGIRLIGTHGEYPVLEEPEMGDISLIIQVMDSGDANLIRALFQQVYGATYQLRPCLRLEEAR